jgi:transcriptional regulator with XRE-family HTH domain
MNGLKYIRTLKGTSLVNLAEYLGISNQAVSAWENGKKSIPAARLKQLSELFGIPEEYFQKELSNNDMFMVSRFNYVQEGNRVFEMFEREKNEKLKPINVDMLKVDWAVNNRRDEEIYGNLFNNSYLRFVYSLDDLKKSLLYKMIQSEDDPNNEFKGINRYIRMISYVNTLFRRDGEELDKLYTFLKDSMKNLPDEE